MKNTDLKKFHLPDSPGIYYFKKGKEILYVGKATSLKDRVKSYFARDITLTRGPKIEKMLLEIDDVEFKETASVLEALILEVNEIKRLQPPANSREKDDKSYYSVVITNEEFPRVLIERGRNLDSNLQPTTYNLQTVFGPFPNSRELKEALRIVRKIFPFRDEKCRIASKLKPCFNAQLGLCPGPCAGRISKSEYRKQIRHIKLFFEGKKEKLLLSLEKEMMKLAKAQKFEEAEKLKHQLFALDHIQDVALINSDLTTNNSQLTTFRIEAYDIAHFGGKEVVGVMTVVVDGELEKSQYRKFKIKADKNDDVNNLKEILTRRLGHSEWSLPQLVVVDGGAAQINGAEDVLQEFKLSIPVVSVVKDERHKAREVLGSKQYVVGREKAILLANAEAHRFAIGYHRKLRRKGFRI